MGKDVLSKIRAGDVYKALVRVLEAEGVDDWTVEDTRPHPSFVFETNGWCVRFHFPCTPKTRGNTQRRCASRLRTGIQSLYYSPGNGREIEIDKHTAADVDNGRLHMETPTAEVDHGYAPAGLIPFEFEGGQIRVLERDGEPWFVARDIARALGYQVPQKAVSDHCKSAEILKSSETEHFNVPARGLTIIAEPDVWRLILRSHLPAAERLEALVVGTILPTIRKTGQYVPAHDPAQGAEAVLALVPQIVEQTIRAVLPAAVKAEVTSQQGYAIVSGITAGEVVAMAGVADRSGLRGVINAVSTSLCEIHRQRGVHVPHPRHGMSSAKMFDPAVCRDWLATGGRDFIRRRVQECRGQTAMVLRIADQREHA